MSSERFDAIVVGGGPAGALSALLLARRRWRIALIERRQRHQTKTCGHCLNPRINGLLRRHGLFEDVKRLACGETRQVRVHVPGRSPLTMEHVALHERGRGACGLLIERAQLDQWLIDAAQAEGVTVYQPATATNIESHDAHTSIEINVSKTDHIERLQAPLVIGADGLRSRVAQHAGLTQRAQVGRCYGFSFDLSDADVPAIVGRTMNMFVMRGGYIGVVRQRGNTLHVGGLISSTYRRNGQRNPVRFVRHMADMFEVLHASSLQGLSQTACVAFSAAGPMPWRPRSIANHRAALVGDAAGYVEPFTGEGMAWAMESADTLDDVLRDARPGTWNGDMARAYAGHWRRRIARRQRCCSLIAMALRRPGLLRTVFQAGCVRERLVRPIVNQVLRPCPS